MWLVLSLLAATSFGLRGILYHWTSQQALNRNALLCGVFFSGALITLVCTLATGSAFTVSSLIGVQMGLLSFGANASMFKGFAVGKASIVAILTALPSAIVVVVAFAVWGETLNMAQLSAFIIIIAGILLVRYSNDITRGNLQGAQWGLLAMLLFAGNDLSGKWSTLMDAPLFPTLVCMFGSGSICFGLWWLRDLRSMRFASLAAGQAAQEIAAGTATMSGTAGITVGARNGTSSQSAKPVAASAAKAANAAGLAIKRSWSFRRTFSVGMAVGITNAVGMMFIVTAFDVGKAGLVSAVTALNVLIVLLYTRFVVKERFSRLETIGISAAFAGILLMRLYGS
ncbi:EamA-like transporter family protein [Paenibacillus algorifonticola]|uniref:EamA-like transporter family protein n=1 Tax=Paenibacillus algorifonticola TaxID=684063 RepID=A0A1I2GSY3_9BACL|nr:EamA family transporter [Paenibacillus algorifonticola]SFF19766.1 EamA-like transporter family protein [Paenibacillus algorifonticola]